MKWMSSPTTSSCADIVIRGHLKAWNNKIQNRKKYRIATFIVQHHCNTKPWKRIDNSNMRKQHHTTTTHRPMWKQSWTSTNTQWSMSRQKVNPYLTPSRPQIDTSRQTAPATMASNTRWNNVSKSQRQVSSLASACWSHCRFALLLNSSCNFSTKKLWMY